MTPARDVGSVASVTIVVVNHNTADDLRRCLLSARREAPAAVIVVDTGSLDGSSDVVRSEFPETVLFSIENRGYGAGANVGLAAVATPYAVLLNSDTVLGAGSITALGAYLERHPAVAVAGPRIVSPDGTHEWTARPHPSAVGLLLQESGLHRFTLRRGETAAGSVGWVLGAALALRLEAIRAVGGFDESFFMYGEEVDLCLRLRRAGWDVHYAPHGSTVVHLGGASTSQQRAAMAAQFVRSTLQLYRRHLSKTNLRAARLILAAALTARLARDKVRLALRPAVDERARLQESVGAWRRALKTLGES